MEEEIWKSIAGYESLYKVSNLGRIRSLDRVTIFKDGRKRVFRGCIIKPWLRRDGYKCVSLSKGVVHKFAIHRLVAQTFIDNPENKEQVNHKDGDKTNNLVSNLEWVTPSENMQHAVDTGLLDSKGEGHWNSKLSYKDVENIRKLYEPYSRDFNCEKLAEMYGVSFQHIHSIIKYNKWC